jgi:hypothetical protein
MFQNIWSLIPIRALASRDSLLRHRQTRRVTSVATTTSPTRMTMRNLVKFVALSYDLEMWNKAMSLFMILSLGMNSPLAMNCT